MKNFKNGYESHFCTCRTHHPCDRSQILQNQFNLPDSFQHLFTCDEDNLERESITLGTSAMGVGWPELPPLLLLTPETADMTVPEPPTTCHHPYIFLLILKLLIYLNLWTCIIFAYTSIGKKMDEPIRTYRIKLFCTVTGNEQETIESLNLNKWKQWTLVSFLFFDIY